MQYSLNDVAEFCGIGVHSGLPCRARVCPAPKDHGIQFSVKDTQGASHLIEASFKKVSESQLGTTLSSPEKSVSISVTEHLLAALYGLSIDNALVEVEGPELPMLDGSAIQFCETFLKIGRTQVGDLRRAIRILRPLEFSHGHSTGSFAPNDGFEVDLTIIYEADIIGTQSYAGKMTPQLFFDQIAAARTFGFEPELEALQRMGKGRGASLENVLAFSDSTILNLEGQRFENEPIRHKVLDAIGDLALLTMPILGQYKAVRPGHSFNLFAMKTLMASKGYYVIEEINLPSELI